MSSSHNQSIRPIKVMDFSVKKLESYSPSLFLAVLESINSVVPPYSAGQFVQVLIPSHANGVFLRRPLSIYYASSQELMLLIQVAGRGTEALSKAKNGDVWNIILPLGRNFSYEPSSSFNPLLIGGGVGIAPMHALGRELQEKGINASFILGARTKEHFSNLDHFKELGQLFLATEDGSLGEKGFVTQHSFIKKGEYSHIFTCGPTPMMKAVAALSKEKDIPCQVSLENHMACGFGVCLCCVEPTIKGNLTVCSEGPVFDVNELLW